jgi:deazaflavin-dependent oxidoreductase (nitroreductase family)
VPRLPKLRLRWTSPPPPRPGSRLARLINAGTAQHVRVYKLTRGRIWGTFPGYPEVPIALIDHVGRKSGERRTTPLIYMPDGDDVVLVASNGGAPKTPAWCGNLLAAPETTVQIGGERRPVVAALAEGDERARLWPKVVEMYPPYGEYQKRTDREIPVLVLRRREA